MDEPAVRRADTLDRGPVGAARSFVDLHVHSSASFDSLADPQKLLRRARQLGLTHLAITDHERISGALRARELAGHGLQVIVGEEVRSSDGDLIGLFLEEAVPPGLDATQTAEAIRAQGGIVGLPHPFDSFRSSGGNRAGRAEGGPAESSEGLLADLAAIVDYVETHNARAYRDANPRAAGFAARHGLPGVASSDAHSVMELGVASTVLGGPFTTAQELLALLPEAQLLTGRASYFVRLWTPIAKVVQRLRGNPRVVPGRAPGSDEGPREP